jgi:hypothetical protein
MVPEYMAVDVDVVSIKTLHVAVGLSFQAVRWGSWS